MNRKQIIKYFYLLAGFSLIACLFFGVMAAHSYILPDFWKDSLGFIQLRPFHVSSALFWILCAAFGSIYAALHELYPEAKPSNLPLLHFFLLLFALIFIYISYAKGEFGGREYWEFPVYIAPFILLAFLVFLPITWNQIQSLKNKPVYEWMWMSGILFLIFTYTENYLWNFDWLRKDLVRDLTIQWKSNGSFVGAWNQLIYGTSFYLMEKISGNKETGKSKLAFALYFLGLFNLMFNWGHHVYTLPTIQYVRYIGYMVSMTEWVFLLKIFYNWKKSITEIQKYYHYFPYRFLMAADIWILLNLILSLMMSIPAINIYTHGTQITVAHAMGTTIGINSMILLAAIFSFSDTIHLQTNKWMNIAFWTTQFSLLIFWLSLIVSGWIRSEWQMGSNKASFGEMMEQSLPWFRVFTYSGSLLMLGLGWIIVRLMMAQLNISIKSGSSK